MIFDHIWLIEHNQRISERNKVKLIRNALKEKKMQKEFIIKVSEDAAQSFAFLEELRQSNLSKRLTRQATRLNLPVPNEREWTKGEKTKFLFMSPALQTELRKAIRQEQKERREMWTTLVKDIVAPIGGIVISILSLLIAYAALKLKH